MAPKKMTSKAKSVKTGGKAKGTDQITKKSDSIEATGNSVAPDESKSDPKSEEDHPKKRITTESADGPPRKASRRSGRNNAKGNPSEKLLLNYLLSASAAELTRPDDEVEDVKDRGDIRTYSASVLNPFEELLCAVILSRPISHRLGLRTIRTALNEPYNFTSARAVQEAGDEKRLQAVYDARTQHKYKTAAQMGAIADAVLDQFTSDDDKNGTQLSKLRDEYGDDVDKAAEVLQKSIKGLGKTGLEIFFRRVQWIWIASFPKIDGRTADSLRMLGLPSSGEELVELIDGSWQELETGHLAGDDEDAKKRRAFVVLLERATGAQLEHKIDDVLVAAAAPTQG